MSLPLYKLKQGGCGSGERPGRPLIAELGVDPRFFPSTCESVFGQHTETQVFVFLTTDSYSCDTAMVSISPCQLSDVLCKGEKFMLCFRRGEYNSVCLSQVVVPAQLEVRQQDMSSGLCIITAKIDGSVLSAPNCSCPFFFLMNEERDSTLSSAMLLLAATVNLWLKVTLFSSWQGRCVELNRFFPQTHSHKNMT